MPMLADINQGLHDTLTSVEWVFQHTFLRDINAILASVPDRHQCSRQLH